MSDRLSLCHKVKVDPAIYKFYVQDDQGLPVQIQQLLANQPLLLLQRAQQPIGENGWLAEVIHNEETAIPVDSISTIGARHLQIDLEGQVRLNR